MWFCTYPTARPTLIESRVGAFARREIHAVHAGKHAASIYDRIDDVGKLTSRVCQGVEIVLAGSSGLDQAAVTQECQMVADGGLALRSKIAAELGDIALFLTQENQHLQPGRIGDLLEQFGDAADLRRRSGRRRACRLGGSANPKVDFVVVGGIVFPKDKSCLCFGQESARCEA